MTDPALPGVQRLETGPPGRRVVWRVSGEGPPLVLLHGGHGAWTHWIRNVGPLAATARVLAPDMPGFGESDDPDDLEDHTTVAGPVLEGIDALIGPSARFDIAAFSFGANVAGEIGLRAPDRLSRLVLVGAGGLRLPRPERAKLRNWRLARDAAEAEAAHRYNLAALMIHREAAIDPRAVAIQTENTRRARFRSRVVARRAPLHDALGRFPASLHGIWGVEDATVGGFLSERPALLRRHDPEASFLAVEGAGHWVQYEAAPVVNRRIADILAGRLPSDPA